MMRFRSAATLAVALLAAAPAWGRSSSFVGHTGTGGGGGSVSVTAGTPNIVLNPSPGLTTFTIGTTNPQNAPADGGSHSYTVLSSDLTQELALVGTFTGLAVPQATGSFAAGASYMIPPAMIAMINTQAASPMINQPVSLIGRPL